MLRDATEDLLAFTGFPPRGVTNPRVFGLAGHSRPRCCAVPTTWSLRGRDDGNR